MKEDKEQEVQQAPSQSAPEENIFIANPAPPKEQQKNTIAWEIIAAIVFVIVLLAGAAGWSFIAANNAADEYTRATSKQLAQLEAPLEDLTPEAVLNNKNIDATLEEITTLKQPNLREVFFASIVSPSYREAKAKKDNVQKHYSALNQYAQDSAGLVSFSNELKAIRTQAAEATVTTQLTNPASLRALGGTLTQYKEQIIAIETPPQLKDTQKQVIAAYTREIEAYDSWAKAIDDKQPLKIVASKAAIIDNAVKIDKATTDEHYIKQFEPSYNTVLKQQKALMRAFNA